jgi:hypothetical protein
MPTDLEDSDVGDDQTPKTNVTQVEICKADPKDPADAEQWYFNGIAGNGEVVVTSELYTTLSDAKRGARDVFPVALMIVEAEEAKDGN